MEPFIIIWIVAISAVTVNSCVDRICDVVKYKIKEKSSPPVYTPSQ